MKKVTPESNVETIDERVLVALRKLGHECDDDSTLPPKQKIGRNHKRNRQRRKK